MKSKILLITIIALTSIPSFSQKTNSKKDTTFRFRYTISSPYLSFTNFDPEASTLYEIHFGYRITPKDMIGIKAVTWKLVAPLGIPWGPYLMNKSENYSGELRETGIGITYQRFLWRGLYGSIEVVPLMKKYLDTSNRKIDTGFRFYTSFHLGYYIQLFKNRLYIQPQIHCNYWPINTKSPTGFAEQDLKWNNNYFLFEPNLYIGVNF
ncbi:MAG: hypothetical protein ACKVOQ_01405 [Cyclobacteriaceae bacterium]